MDGSHLNADQYRQMIDDLQAMIAQQQQTLDTLKNDVAFREQLERQVAAGESVDALKAKLKQFETDEDYKIALTLTLANSAFDALMVLDEQHRVIAINNSAEELFDYQRPIGVHLADLTGSSEIDMMVDDALQYKEESFEEQITINKRVYRVRVQVIERKDNLFVGLALQDITELVRLNRARRDMVANISHELRTPIANIRLIIDSLFHEQDKPRGKQSRSALKAIARETDSLLWLVQELLDLSMIESGQAILRMVDVPAEMLVDEAIERMLDQSETKNIRLVRHVPDGIHVLCDRDQARRVLINLIHNAFKWSPPGESIAVVVYPPENEEVRFEVLDNGPGVPEDLRERIFERFYQADPSRSKGDGTGLGLAISRHIVEAHGGRIWVDSNPDGSGARFIFTLPNAEGQAAVEDESDEFP